MKTPIHIFSKIFVQEFYRQNAILFLIVLGIGGGLMSGREHIALAEFCISNTLFTLIPLSLWIFYFIKVLDFILHTTIQKENEIVYHLPFYSKYVQYTTLTLAWINLLIPIIGYGIFLILIAGRNQQFASAFLLLSYIIILTAIGIAKHLHILHYPNGEVKTSRLKKWFDKRWTRNYSLMLIEYIMRKHMLTVLLLKVLGFFLLIGIGRLYNTEQFDDRLLNMTVIAVFAMNSVFTFTTYQLENIEFALIRNLPLSLGKRLFYLMTCWIILCLPETALIARSSYMNFTWTHAPVSIFLGISIFILINSFLYVKSLSLTKLTPLIFYVSMAQIVLILSHVPAAILMIFNLVTGISLYARYYYREQAH